MVFMLMLMLQSGDRGAAGQRHEVHMKIKKKGTFHSPFHSARVEKTPYRYPPLPAVTLTAALAA